MGFVVILLALILWALLDRERAGRWIGGAFGVLAVLFWLALTGAVIGLGAFAGYSLFDSNVVGGWIGGIVTLWGLLQILGYFSRRAS